MLGLRALLPGVPHCLPPGDLNLLRLGFVLHSAGYTLVYVLIEAFLPGLCCSDPHCRVRRHLSPSGVPSGDVVLLPDVRGTCTVVAWSSSARRS